MTTHPPSDHTVNSRKQNLHLPDLGLLARSGKFLAMDLVRRCRMDHQPRSPRPATTDAWHQQQAASAAYFACSFPAQTPVTRTAVLQRHPAPPIPGAPLVYLNIAQVRGGKIGNTPISRDYQLACEFLHCGIMDRTGTLDQGFDYETLDPIPTPAPTSPSFAELCDQHGRELVHESISTSRHISVLWSGGIDSTATLIAIAKAAKDADALNRITVLLSLDSVAEYPGFFLNHIHNHLPFRAASRPISASLDPAALNITGEHGDQLFGSQLNRPFVLRGIGGDPWREAITAILLERMGTPHRARTVFRYLEPVVNAAPVPLNTVHDYFWWLNFALKWQCVSLRLAAMAGGHSQPLYRSLRHFYRDARFQRWSLANTPGNAPNTWPEYKREAKAYILAHTGDEQYFRDKVKEDSLRNVMSPVDIQSPVRIVMGSDLVPIASKI